MTKYRSRKTSLTHSARITAYTYKTLLFFGLVVASFIGINFVIPSVYGDTHCEQGWLNRAVGALFDCSDNSGRTLQSDGDNEDKTIWNPLAKSWLTQEQVDLLKQAYDIGYQDGGEQHALLLQSTLLQESIAGQLGRVGHRTAPVGKRSYGVMQVKVSAASDVLEGHPQLGALHTDEELIVRLMTDDQFNLQVASKFLLYLRNKTNSDAEALVAYNMGLRASKRFETHEDFNYVKSVNRYFENIVVPFNRKYLGHENSIPSPV